MKNNLWLRWVRGYAAVVGVMDLATGLGLMAMPAFTLAQMGAVAPGAEALGYVRFSGVFVGAVGASYLVALARGGVARLRGALEFTLIARTGAGGFSAVAVAAGWFDRAWLVVAATDLACAAIQAWILARGMADDE
jgi:hypothetical protein